MARDFRFGVVLADVETPRATTTTRLGTCVLNAGFNEEFDAAKLPFATGGERVEHLTHVVGVLRAHCPKYRSW